MILTKRNYNTFLYRWLLQLRERRPRLRGKRLKYNLLMSKRLEEDLGL